MRYTKHVAAAACLSLLAVPVLANNGNGKGRANAPGQLLEVQLLGFNDYHGHVKSDAAGQVDGQDAGGGEYLAAKLRQPSATTSSTGAWTS